MKSNMFIMALLIVMATAASVAIPQPSSAIGNDEWLDIDMQFATSADDLRITCEKPSNVEEYGMVMTIIDHNTNKIIHPQLHTTSESPDVITNSIPLPDSLIKVFCEYADISSGDKVGYAIMRTFS